MMLKGITHSGRRIKTTVSRSSNPTGMVMLKKKKKWKTRGVGEDMESWNLVRCWWKLKMETDAAVGKPLSMGSGLKAKRGWSGIHEKRFLMTLDFLTQEKLKGQNHVG